MILGAHRSGTSALAGVLTRLGAQAPRTLMVPTKDNPRGYFESLEFLKIHDSILRAAGSRWNDWGPVNPDFVDTPTAEQFKPQLLAAIAKEFGDAPMFLVKDPRASLFFPLWRETLDATGIVPKVVVQLRHPLEVARSLEARDTFSRTRSLLIWLRYQLEAERGSRGVARVFSHYSRLLADWKGEARRIGKGLALKWPRMSGDTVLAIEEFLSGELRHHAFRDDEIPGDAPLAGWLGGAYQALCRLSESPADVEAQATLDRIRAEFDASGNVYAAVVREHETRVEGLYAGVKRQLAEKVEESRTLAERIQALESERGATARAHEEALRKAGERLAALAAERDAAILERERELRQLGEQLAAGAVARDAAIQAREQESQKLGERLSSAVAELHAAVREREQMLALRQEEQRQQRALELRLEASEAERAAVLRRHEAAVEAQKAASDRTVELSAQLVARQEEATRSAAELEAARRELAQAREAIEERFAEIARLTTLLLAQEDACKRSVDELAALEERSAALQARSAALLEHAIAALRNARGLEQRLLDHRDAARSYRRALDDIVASRIWRWTAPIRPRSALPPAYPLSDAAGDGVARAAALLDESALFDADWYRSRYAAQLAAADLDPVRHYLLEGAARGFDPGPGFSTVGYLLRYPDVRDAGVNPLVHYLERGISEGRVPSAAEPAQ